MLVVHYVCMLAIVCFAATVAATAAAAVLNTPVRALWGWGRELWQTSC